MSDEQSRAEFLKANPHAKAWAALDEATNEQMKTTPGPICIGKDQFKGKKTIIIGSGVAGLTTAYELLHQQSGMEVTVLEAQNRTGGRCLSLRTGDTLTEDKNSRLDSEPGETQVVRFKRPVGDAEPYLNAGPGRIPSSHKRLLDYLRKFGVPVEIYVMNSESNLVHIAGKFGSKSVVYRRLDHNARGWLAQMVYQNAEQLLEEEKLGIKKKDVAVRVKQLQDLMVKFGELTELGQYAPTAGEPGFENARSRAGFDVLPGVAAGKVAEPISLDTLLDSEFWKNFYQPVDFLWQPSLFQPVGGMDRVQHAFAQQIASLGATVHLNSPVKKIEWDHRKKQFVVHVSQIGTDKCTEHYADYCFSNLAMPFLKNILSKELQGKIKGKGFEDPFKASLHAVYRAQFSKGEDGFAVRFLANTTKVGWQADRCLWQGRSIEKSHCKECNEDIKVVRKTEEGVVPIFGGISWTSHQIKQIWYPSNDYHDEKGVLTGAYNFADTAYKWGKMPIKKRLEKAREGAEQFNKSFGKGLGDGIAIAWQNMPYIKGGWAQWQSFGEKPAERKAAVDAFNILTQGTGVYGPNGKVSKPVFFIVGDQVSSLPGWQEGAIASSLNALSRLARPDLTIPHLKSLPDTRLMVEGI